MKESFKKCFTTILAENDDYQNVLPCQMSKKHTECVEYCEWHDKSELFRRVVLICHSCICDISYILKSKEKNDKTEPAYVHHVIEKLKEHWLYTINISLDLFLFFFVHYSFSTLTELFNLIAFPGLFIV